MAPNRLDQNFDARRPDQLGTADITYLATSKGWLCLAAVLDLCPLRGAHRDADIFTAHMKLIQATTWGEIAEDRGLSEPLIEESYSCTNGKSVRFGSIRDVRVASGTTIVLVLKPGACKGRSPAQY